MGRTQRLYDRLDRLEDEFHVALVEELRACVAGRRDLLFLAADYRPAHWPPCLSSPVTENLLCAADEIVGLRKKLGEPRLRVPPGVRRAYQPRQPPPTGSPEARCHASRLAGAVRVDRPHERRMAWETAIGVRAIESGQRGTRTGPDRTGPALGGVAPCWVAGEREMRPPGCPRDFTTVQVPARSPPVRRRARSGRGTLAPP